MFIVKHPFPVCFQSGNATGPRPGGDEYAPGPIAGGSAVPVLNLYGVIIYQASVSQDGVDLVFTHQEGHAFGEAFGHPATALDNARKIDLNPGYLDAEFGRGLDQLQHFGAAQKGFGGNAAPVQANSTKIFFFYNGSFQTELGGTDGGDISAGPASNDDDVKIHTRRFLVGHKDKA